MECRERCARPRQSAARARALLALLLFATPACGASVDPASVSNGRDALGELRSRMVDEQIQSRGVRDERVLAAMRSVPRHLFAPGVAAEDAYEDRPHSIGHRQTISQPYIVGLMTELAQLPERARVLEVGTGSGYQAAVLCAMGAEVYSIEIVAELAAQAEQTLALQGYVAQVRAGDGYQGWPEAAPFDAILVTAAAPRIPEPLLEQLAIGGRLVIPVDHGRGLGALFGDAAQRLEVHRRTDHGIEREESVPVRFVPMTGEVRERKP